VLVLKRKEGHWLEVTHAASGDVLRVRVQDIKPGKLNLVFDDPERNFAIERPERRPPDLKLLEP
jgi:hypothetical protein